MSQTVLLSIKTEAITIQTRHWIKKKEQGPV